MALQMIETSADALIDYLKANIEAKILVVAARYSDDPAIPIEDIAQWDVGSMPPATPRLPAVVLVGKGDEARRLALNSPNYTVDNDFDLIVLVGDPDVERRFRRLSRYKLALLELMQAGEATFGYRFSTTGPSELSEPMAAEPFIQGISVPIRLSRTETR